jgi:hypothetical protein
MTPESDVSESIHDALWRLTGHTTFDGKLHKDGAKTEYLVNFDKSIFMTMMCLHRVQALFGNGAAGTKIHIYSCIKVCACLPSSSPQGGRR